MGAQMGALLKAACVAVNGLAVVRGLILFKTLPDEAIPMKFGIFGEVKWCAQGRQWFLLYPGLSLVLGLTPLLVSDAGKKVPEWVTKPEIFKQIMDMTTDATCLYTGALMLLIIEQMPSIIKQQTGLPSGVTMGYMSLLFGTFTSAFLAAQWLSA